MFKPLLIMVLAATAASGPASAQVTSLESATAMPKGGSQDRVVCEREEATGSRLAARRVCLTVLQWEEKRREHRESTEKVQRIVNQAPSGR